MFLLWGGIEVELKECCEGPSENYEEKSKRLEQELEIVNNHFDDVCRKNQNLKEALLLIMESVQ